LDLSRLLGLGGCLRLGKGSRVWRWQAGQAVAFDGWLGGNSWGGLHGRRGNGRRRLRAGRRLGRTDSSSVGHRRCPSRRRHLRYLGLADRKEGLQAQPESGQRGDAERAAKDPDPRVRSAPHRNAARRAEWPNLSATNRPFLARGRRDAPDVRGRIVAWAIVVVVRIEYGRASHGEDSERSVSIGVAPVNGRRAPV
jgi:hypothetical protein